MARQTRQQRRARREQQADGGGAAIQRARTRQQQPPRSPTPPQAAEAGGRGPGKGARRFVSEAVGELKKVEWPGRPQLIQGVAVVMIACVIVGAYLWGADLVFKRLVQNVFLGQ